MYSHPIAQKRSREGMTIKKSLTNYRNQGQEWMTSRHALTHYIIKGIETENAQ